MKKSLFLAIVFLSIVKCTWSQVPKKIIVEHFTNTVCSVCASRNPGFYSNLANHPDILHLSVHPSSPYSSCLFNQHNTPENDGRTNYYGIYGGTPRLVIQGVVVSASTSYNSAAIFTPYLGQNSPASITIHQTKYGGDSIRSRVVIKTETAHALGTLRLFVALAEDTVFYAAPNGEGRHYDVFRKSLTPTSGMSVTLPSVVGDSIEFSAVSNSNIAWDFSRIYTMAILQEETTKSVVQASAVNSGSTSGIQEGINLGDIKVYPNPVKNVLTVDLKTLVKSVVSVYDIYGKLIFSGSFQGTADIDFINLSKGIYFLMIENEEGKISKLISKQ